MPDRAASDEPTPAEPVYACAGPERIPEHVRVLLEAAGRHFADEGYRLRCAQAGGVDAALRAGLEESDVDVLLPWDGYHPHQQEAASQPRLYRGEADEKAARCHPDWHRLRDSVRRVEAARTARVTGGAGHPSAQFVLCWTPGGATAPEEIMEWTQGASQPIRVAAGEGIPIINTKLDACRERIEALLGPEDLPAGASPRASSRLSGAAAREAFADMHAEAKARREAEEKRQKEQEIEQTPIPSGKATPTKKASPAAKRKEKESQGQGDLFG